MKEQVNNPKHYGGKDNPYEVINVIEAWGLGFCLGNVIKYVARAGKKDPAKCLEDLEKASWYLERERENQGENKRQELELASWFLGREIENLKKQKTESQIVAKNLIDLKKNNVK